MRPERCPVEEPALRRVAGYDHLSACHYAEELVGVGVEAYRQRAAVQEAEVDAVP